MKALVAVLHSVRSVHNVGSIFRTADAAGVAKLFLCGVTPSPVDRFGGLRPQFAKVALGAERSVAWERAPAAGKVLQKLRRDGYRIYAVEQCARAKPYHRVRPHQGSRIAIVVGNEVHGLPKSIIGLSDTVLEIPMRGKKESLNVSVAFGIVAYRLRYR